MMKNNKKTFGKKVFFNKEKNICKPKTASELLF